MPITAHEFGYIQQLVLDHSAIVLDSGKEYLAESRLSALSRREGLSSVHALVEQLRSQPLGTLHHKVVEAMTTNETLFFRDFHPFEMLRNTILPEILQRNAKERQLSILCAACSSGQEPYSIAMLVREHFPQIANWSFHLLASDLSSEVLARARIGRYSQLEVNRGLPARYLVKYFRKRGLDWEIHDEIRRMVEFFEMNLAGAWPELPLLDIMFLRNVLIYFDLDSKKKILNRVRLQLRPDGFLFLGTAEATLKIDEFERLQCGKGTCYRPPPFIRRSYEV